MLNIPIGIALASFLLVLCMIPVQPRPGDIDRTEAILPETAAEEN